MNDAQFGLHGKWSISPEGGKDQISVWSLSEPITLEAGSELRSLMRFDTLPARSDQNLGRFRLSVSSDPTTSDWEQKRLLAMNVAEPWSRLAIAYAAERPNRRGVALL